MVQDEAIHYSRCHLAPTASSVAFQLGYLEDELARTGGGCKVDIKLGDYSHDGDRYWLRHAANAKALWARSRGADTRAVAFSWYESSLPILVMPGSGIERPADLRGRRIASIQVKNQEFDYDRMVHLKPFVSGLATAGLELKDVEQAVSVVERELIHDQAPTARNFLMQVAELLVRQLLRREVDAIAAVVPREVARFFDLRTIYDGRTDPDVNARVDLRALVVSGSVIRDRRDALVGVVAGLLRAGQWAKEHPARVLQLIAADVRTPEDVLRARGVDFVRASEVDVNDELIEIMRKRKDFLLASGLLQADVSIGAWIDGSVIADARALLAKRKAAA